MNVRQGDGNQNDSGTARTAPGTTDRDPARLIVRLVRRARLVLLAERIWPPLALLLGILALFAGLSWMGLWTAIAPLWRAVILLLFAATFVVPVVALARVRRPGRAEAIARIEADSQRPHRPLTAFGDRPAGDGADPVTQALWQAHHARVTAEIAALKVAPPAPRLYRRDPYALRTLAGLVLFVGLFAGAVDYRGRLLDAFAPLSATPSASAARLDAWIAPPAYTGRAPVFLTGEAGREPTRNVRVTAGSELIVRLQGVADGVVSLTDSHGTRVLAAAAGPAGERRTILTGDGSARVTDGASTLAEWTFTVDRDTAPTVRWTADPAVDKTGALVLSYGIGDDYGVTAARAEITPVMPPDARAPRPLSPPPDMPLVLPPRPATGGEARTAANLASHPFAGARVRIVLVARDEAGQEGRSEVREIVLPERAFRSPLARAVVEQRRNLALDAGNQVAVIEALDALMIAPDGIFDRPADYLGMRMAYHHLVAAQNDDALRPLLDEFWQLALAIDEGSAGDAAAALRAAQERLREAIRNGAPPDEIARLSDELRKAMQNYLSALAEQARRRGPTQASPPPADARTVTPQDLERMLKEIERLSKSGQQEAAEQLLAQLQSMLEGMQMASPGQGGPGQSGKGQLDALGRMIQNQQNLMDDTYRLDRGTGEQADENAAPSSPGGQGESGQGEAGQGSGGQQQAAPQPDGSRKDGSGKGPAAPLSPDDLRRRQGELQQQLDKLMDQLGNLPGAGEGEKGEAGRKALDNARKAMGESGEALGRSDTADALERQTEALEALRRGARDIADQMAEAMAGENGTQPGGPSGARAAGNQDPLGRERGSSGPDFGNSVKVPDEIDVQRARRILDELRRRLGEPGRPQDELDYLERLLPGD